jgi:hypothetical protein
MCSTDHRKFTSDFFFTPHTEATKAAIFNLTKRRLNNDFTFAEYRLSDK